MDINVTVLIVGMNEAKCVNTTQITLCSKKRPPFLLFE